MMVWHAGGDVQLFVPRSGKLQSWGGNDVRLRKVGQSLLLFGQDDLHASLNLYVPPTNQTEIVLLLQDDNDDDGAWFAG
jgi:hypothetical protein